MRYRKGSSDILTTTVLNFPKSAEQENIFFKAYDINSNSVENKYKFWSCMYSSLNKIPVRKSQVQILKSEYYNFPTLLQYEKWSANSGFKKIIIA